MASTAEPERWLDEHGDALYAYAMMRVHNTAVAEDLVQETLLAAFQGVNRFDGRSQQRTWLIGILKHKLYDHLRRATREAPLEDDRDGDDFWADRFDHTGHWLAPPTSWGDPQRAAENADLAEILQRCIERLPERQRKLFVLREIDGCATEELIDVLGISSANNLWVMLSRARGSLRDCVEHHGFGARA